MDQIHFRDLALATQIPHEMSTGNLTLLHVLPIPKQRPQTLTESHIFILIWAAAPLLLCPGSLILLLDMWLAKLISGRFGVYEFITIDWDLYLAQSRTIRFFY